MDNNTLRPCLVIRPSWPESHPPKRALFHQWVAKTNKDGDQYVRAVVELENGAILEWDRDLLVFLDTQERMAAFKWPELEELEHDDV